MKLKGWNFERLVASCGWASAMANHLPALAAEQHCRYARTSADAERPAVCREAALRDETRLRLVDDGEDVPDPSQ